MRLALYILLGDRFSSCCDRTDVGEFLRVILGQNTRSANEGIDLSEGYTVLDFNFNFRLVVCLGMLQICIVMR